MNNVNKWVMRQSFDRWDSVYTGAQLTLGICAIPFSVVTVKIARLCGAQGDVLTSLGGCTMLGSLVAATMMPYFKQKTFWKQLPDTADASLATGKVKTAKEAAALRRRFEDNFGHISNRNKKIQDLNAYGARESVKASLKDYFADLNLDESVFEEFNTDRLQQARDLQTAQRIKQDRALRAEINALIKQQNAILKVAEFNGLANQKKIMQMQDWVNNAGPKRPAGVIFAPEAPREALG